MNSSTGEAWDRLQELFAKAIEHEPHSRSRFLDDACGDDPAMRLQVEELLEAYSNADEVLDPTSDNVPQCQRLLDLAVPLPEQVGSYRVVRLIDSGGMGNVYEVEQEEPRRRAALKVMRQGLVSESALRRFQYESQLLGRLQHPNIAHIFEAGTHQDGNGSLPFFAMEYVSDARSITQYSRASGLDTRLRLELFATVCEAVGYAHQKGVIHRDLKPSNILVDSQGRVKVIDFGVARSTDADMNLATWATHTGDLLGTVQYMSPEQTHGDPDQIDTRSDVYSLGVVLYELLADRLPYDVARMNVVDAAEVIRTCAVSRLGSSDTKLRGELEIIVSKALEKDSDRRYQSAAELGDDIRRHLSGHAVLARPASAVYRLRLFGRRNKAVCAASLAVFVALVVGTIVSTSLYVRAESARAQAESDREQARQTRDDAVAVREFLIGMFDVARPNNVGDKLSVGAMLDTAIEGVDKGAIADQPLLEATIRETVAELYGDSNQKSPQLKIALSIRRRVQGQQHPDSLATASRLAYSKLLQGKKATIRDGAALARETLGIQTSILGPEHPDTLRSMEVLSSALRRVDQFDEAESLLRRSIDIRRRLQGAEHADTLRAMGSFAFLAKNRGNVDEAIQILRRILEIQRRVNGETHVDTLVAIERLAFVIRIRGSTIDHQSARAQEDLREAESLARDVLKLRRDRFGNWLTLKAATYTLATSLRDQCKYAEAEPLLRGLVDDKRAREGESSDLATIICELGILQRRMGDLNDSEETLKEALRLLRKIHGNDNFNVGNVLTTLGITLHVKKEYSEAEQVLLESYSILAKGLGDDNPRTLFTAKRLIALYEALGDADTATIWREKLPVKNAEE